MAASRPFGIVPITVVHNCTKLHENHLKTFCVICMITDKRTHTGKNSASLAEIMMISTSVYTYQYHVTLPVILLLIMVQRVIVNVCSHWHNVSVSYCAVQRMQFQLFCGVMHVHFTCSILLAIVSCCTDDCC